jgi:hypothetical protein
VIGLWGDAIKILGGAMYAQQRDVRRPAGPWLQEDCERGD